MLAFITHSLGLVHFLAAMLAVVAGSLVYATRKGSCWHKRIGYVYVVSMVVTLVTAFMSYQLTGRFGPFHVAAVFSSVCILGGMVPVMLKQRVKYYLYWHYYFINWSVVGLYAAFWAETLSRMVPMQQFWPVVVGISTVTTALGGRLIRRNQHRYLGTESRTLTENPAKAIEIS